MAVYTTINDPSAYFQTLLYTGDGSASQAQTNTGNSDLQPDWIWVKKTNDVRNTSNTDSSRGFNKRMETQTTTAESTTTTDVISAQSNGFTVGNNGSTGNNGDTYAAWQWKANGGTTATNNDGDITTTVQANTTAGFSIVTYTGNNTGGATIGHGLGVAPKVVFTKTRAIADNWLVYHEGIGATKYLTLNTTSASATSTGAWNDTAPSSTVVTLGSFDNSNDNDNMVAYCFAEIQGYSEFSSYTGNGNADGPFVYTGFKPTWLLIKNTTAVEGWFLHDAKVDDNGVNDEGNPAGADGNPRERRFQVNITQSEVGTTTAFDFVSNGFKLRTDTGSHNGNGNSFIYMAFAEHPFVSSKGVPTTAI